MRVDGSRRTAPLELKVVVAIAGLGALLLMVMGVSVLRSGGTRGLLLGGGAILVAVAQSFVLVGVYQLRPWSWSAVIALLVAGAVFQAGAGDYFGAVVSVFIAGYLYTRRDVIVG